MNPAEFQACSLLRHVPEWAISLPRNLHRLLCELSVALWYHRIGHGRAAGPALVPAQPKATLLM